MDRIQARRLQPTPVWLGRLSMELRRLAVPLLGGHLKGLLSITFDIPLQPLAAPSARNRNWFYWRRPGEREVLLGLGRALFIEEAGEQRFPSLDRQWRKLQDDWTHINQGSANPRARAFLGFAFDPAGDEDNQWRGFPNAVLMVPQLLMEWRDGHCMLTFNHLRRQGDRPDRVVSEWLSRLNGLLRGEEGEDAGSGSGLHTTHEVPAGESWQRQVVHAVEAMQRGRLSKVVLARELQLSFGQAVGHRQLLSRLAADYPGCTLFGVRFDGATLVGATPERLLSVGQGEVVSDALAGTLEEPQARPVEAMVRHEHMPVVKAILAALEPYCSEVEAGQRPVSIQLQRLSHLYTRVRGSLKPAADLFGLLQSLHPTPAVGGLPREAALEWIREREEIRRGWYTGALGWLGSAGEAEISVILRCGLIDGRGVRLFSGAGITAVSDPVAEFAETQLKFSALLDRLSR